MSEKMFDAEEQSDEIFALQSIYGDDIFACDNSKMPYEGNFIIYVQNNSVPFEVRCQGKILTVKSLFPINLYFSMPSNYPFSNPPESKIYCTWLTSDQLDILSKEMYNRWKEGNNSVVLFNWINFLEFEALKFLDLKFPINLEEEELRKLAHFNLQRENEIFSRELHECPVCFCQKPGSKIFRVERCGHMFCKNCLTEFLEIHIKDGNVNALICPAEKCDVQIFPNDIQYLVSGQEFERYERLLLQITLEVMKDVDYCPRLKCGQPVIIEKGDKIGLCQCCNFAFCTRCKSTYHGLGKCKDEEVIAQAVMSLPTKESQSKPICHVQLLQMRDDYMKGDSEDKKEMERVYGKKVITAMLNYFISEKWIGKNFKQCPRCESAIEKLSGCNKINCIRCRTNFCWICMKLLGENPYNHFSETTSQCYKKLFNR